MYVRSAVRGSTAPQAPRPWGQSRALAGPRLHAPSLSLSAPVHSCVFPSHRSFGNFPGTLDHARFRGPHFDLSGQPGPRSCLGLCPPKQDCLVSRESRGSRPAKCGIDKSAARGGLIQRISKRVSCTPSIMSTDEPIGERKFSSPVCCFDLDRVPPTAPERGRSIQGPSSPVETSGPAVKASADTVPPAPFMGASATDPPAASVAAPHLRFAVPCTVDDCRSSFIKSSS